MEHNKAINEGFGLMFNFLKAVFFCMSFLIHSNLLFANAVYLKHNFHQMTCNELMLGLIRDSSFNKKFLDKTLALEFYFERFNDRYIELKFVTRAGDDKDGIYANFELDLVDKTLNIIDPDPPIPIKINKDYISYIANKCTPDKNLHGSTGRSPDLDGS